MAGNLSFDDRINGVQYPADGRWLCMSTLWRAQTGIGVER